MGGRRLGPFPCINFNLAGREAIQKHIADLDATEFCVSGV